MRKQKKIQAEAKRSGLAFKRLFSRLPEIQEVTLNVNTAWTHAGTKDGLSPPDIALYIDKFNLDHLSRLQTLRKVTFIGHCGNVPNDLLDDPFGPVRIVTQCTQKIKDEI